MARQSDPVFPGIELDAMARKLRDLLVAFAPNPLAPSEASALDPVDVTIGQLSQGNRVVSVDPLVVGVDRYHHPQPCRCRPCGFASAILLLDQERNQRRGPDLPAEEASTIQRPEALRDLAELALSIHRQLQPFESKLADHVGRWETLHERLLPLGDRGHIHETMCARPARALETVRRLAADLEPLAEGLLAELRPEHRAIGHRPPDTFFVEFVRILALADVTRDELADWIVEACGTASGDRDYWRDRIGRALRREGPTT